MPNIMSLGGGGRPVVGSTIAQLSLVGVIIGIGVGIDITKIEQDNAYQDRNGRPFTLVCPATL